MTKTYTRRTPEQMVADLEAKIAAVKARAATKKAKAEPAGKALLVAAKAVDKAIEAAQGNEELVRALEAGRAPMSAWRFASAMARATKRFGRNHWRNGKRLTPPISRSILCTPASRPRLHI